MVRPAGEGVDVGRVVEGAQGEVEEEEGEEERDGDCVCVCGCMYVKGVSVMIRCEGPEVCVCACVYVRCERMQTTNDHFIYMYLLTSTETIIREDERAEVPIVEVEFVDMGHGQGS